MTDEDFIAAHLLELANSPASAQYITAPARDFNRLVTLAAESMRWRARCPVTAADVEGAGVTAEQCEAFLLANGGESHGRFHVLSPGEDDLWTTWMDGGCSAGVAIACNQYSRWSGTPAQDVLVAMQRTEVG